jgi:hypothetical protein
MSVNQDNLKSVRQRQFLVGDFNSFRASLLDYARQFYPDRISDFSEASLGGLFLDFAAAVGDNMSFYLSHQFSELNSTTAVELTNIERSLIADGVPITGAAPAIVPVTVYVQIPVILQNNSQQPNPDALPIIKQGSIFSADNGVQFILLEDIDFSSKYQDGTYVSTVVIGQKASNGTPQTYIFSLAGLCISGNVTSETVSLGTFQPFKKITLSNPNVTDILSVSDGVGNNYYQVTHLTQDVVYRNVLNTTVDADIVKDVIKIVPAPYRYTADVDLATRSTTITLGGGSADTLEDDVIPDPSDFAIAFPYSKTFSRISIDPLMLIQTKTLGVSAINTTLTITYRYGGGLNHNVQKNSIKNINTINVFFPNNPSATIASAVKNSIEITNDIPAKGGDDALTPSDLSTLAPQVKNSQERIVSREDLLARIYTLPSNFGRVFRAQAKSNPINPLATQLYIISRDIDGNLTTSSDTLKQNLVRYLNPYRQIADAIDVLDAPVVNFTVNFNILADPSLNKSVILQNIITQLIKLFDVKNVNIDQPLQLSNIRNTIFSTTGVLSIIDLQIQNISGVVNNRQYSDVVHDIANNTFMDLSLPPRGGVFFVAYPNYDIIGKAS